jgi:ribonuclease-3 family protein
VYELFVRARLASSVKGSVNRLHRLAIDYVRSTSQADAIKNMQAALTDREREIVRRGRNSKSGFVPKNADVVEYRHATGFEALIGYLYLRGETARLLELMGMAADRVAERLGEKGVGQAGGRSGAQ